jgi:hypothetical protein
MKKICIFMLGALLLSVYPVAANAICGPPPSTPPKPPPNCNNMMGPTAQNALGNLLQLKEKAESLLDQAIEQGLDVTDIQEMLDKANALLEMAEKIKMANPIPANNMMLEAQQLYEDAISDLEALLG